MSTDLVPAAASALAITPGQSGWTDQQMAVIRQIGTQKATKADLDLFLHVCLRTGLDPFLKQIHLVEYGGKPTIQTGIDGFRVVARRAADAAQEPLEYEDTQWCGPDGVWADVWLQDGPPAAARATVLRGGRRFTAVALYSEFVGMKKEYDERTNKPTGRMVTNSMWSGKPAHMLGKVVEALALRKAFPNDLGGVHAPEELDHRTVQGEVVREERPPAEPGEQLVAAMALVAGAGTREDLAAVWAEFGTVLSVADRARLSAAIKASPAYLAETPPAPAPEADEDGVVIEADVEDPPY